jgi:hypothetical protein
VVNVNIIRAFEGPLHSRLEKIWERIAAANKDRMNLHVFDNLGARRNHAKSLQAQFDQEIERPETHAIFTEFDFLPEEGFLDETEADVEAAEYVTRSAETLEQTSHGISGGWFIRLYKSDQLLHWLHSVRVGLGDGWGQFRDPANGLFEGIQQAGWDVRKRLLPSQDCYPDTYGARTPGRGVHLFWSRHYNDQPTSTVAGFGLAPILRGVKRYIARYEKALDRSDGALPQASVLTRGNSTSVK